MKEMQESLLGAVSPTADSVPPPSSGLPELDGYIRFLGFKPLMCCWRHSAMGRSSGGSGGGGGCLRCPRCFLSTFADAAYSSLVFLCTAAALPYFWYMELAFHDPASTSVVLYTLLLNLQPPLAWVTGFWYFRGLFGGANGHYSAVAVPLTEQALRSRDEFSTKFRRKVHNFIVFGWVANVVFWLLYVVWLFQMVYIPVFMTLPMSQQLLWVFLPVSFVYRLWVPMFLCLYFAVVCESHVSKIDQSPRELQDMFRRNREQRKEGASTTMAGPEVVAGWDSVRHPSAAPSRIAELVENIAYNIRLRRRTQRAWTFHFTSVHAMPLMSVVLMIYFLVVDKAVMLRVWVFIVYAVHFCAQAGWVFRSAQRVTEHSFQARRDMYEVIAKDDSGFAVEDRQRVGEFSNFMMHCYDGFCIWGLPVTAAEGGRILQLLFAVVGPIVVMRVLLPR